MVPPWVGSGWAKTTAAFGVACGTSMSASSRPAGPVRSRTAGIDELTYDSGKPIGLRDEPDVPGPIHHGVFRIAKELHELAGRRSRNDPIELRRTGDHQRSRDR